MASPLELGRVVHFDPWGTSVTSQRIIWPPRFVHVAVRRFIAEIPRRHISPINSAPVRPLPKTLHGEGGIRPRLRVAHGGEHARAWLYVLGFVQDSKVHHAAEPDALIAFRYCAIAPTAATIPRAST
jgi:hypothetical protein